MNTKTFIKSLYGILLTLIIAGCGGGGGNSGTVTPGGGGPSDTAAPDTTFGAGITLSTYTADDVKPNPVGGGAIIGGQLIVDFDDIFTRDEIDTILVANGLERIGFITGVNQVIARITNGASELDAQAAIVTVPGVEAASLDFIVGTQTTSGTVRPLLDNDSETNKPREPNKPLLTLSDEELLRNWPHYVMDTFPAHALADAVLGGDSLQNVVLGVVETSGFHKAQVNSGVFSRIDTLLAPGDRNLYPKVVEPTGIEYVPTTGAISFTRGTRDPSFNKLISSANEVEIHGLAVASAALGAGPDILGTSRHAKFRPIKISTETLGICSNDRTIGCDFNTDCPVGTGSCDTDISVTSYLSAMFAALADENAPNLKVVNVSLGEGKAITDETQRAAASRIIGASLSRLIGGGRVVVLAAGNDHRNTSGTLMASLGPSRTVDRSVSSNVLDKGLIVASGTALPTISILDILALALDPLSKPVPIFDGNVEGAYKSGNYGPNISVSAPGEYVPVLAGDLVNFLLMDGTSFSSPYIAGLAAEMFTLDPTLTNVEVVKIIEATVDDLGDTRADNIFGHGRINLWKAILTTLNRKDTENPNWLGINLRWGVIGVPEQIFIGGKEVPDILGARVPDLAQVLGDNLREVPNANIFPAAAVTKFSFETTEITNATGGVALIEAKESGRPIYQIPVRISDLLNTRPVDSTIDDFVVTLDVHTQTAAIWGRVTNGGNPVNGATVSYVELSGAAASTTTDSNGYYTIYDAIPDEQFEIAASKVNFIGDAYDLTLTPMLSQRRDFDIVEIDIVEIATPDFNRFGMDVGVLGHYNAVAPDGPYSYDSDGTISTWQSYPGSFSGNTFTGSYSRSYGTTLTITGSITATLNESGDTITSINWSEKHVSTQGVGSTKDYSFSGTNIPLAWSEVYQIEGVETCDHVSSFSNTLNSGPDGLNYSLSSYECNADSKIYASFSTVVE